MNRSRYCATSSTCPGPGSLPAGSSSCPPPGYAGGTTYVTDTPGPASESPTIVLLHALGCTGLLTWFPGIEPLSRRYRVVTLDLRWHGQGIQSEEFSLSDCADDVVALLDVLAIDRAVVGGYSMGSIVDAAGLAPAPRAAGGPGARGHDRPVSDERRRAVLLRGDGRHDAGHPRRLAIADRGARRRVAADAVDFEPTDIQEWALREFKSTSPWAVGQALSALGRHHSRPWLGRSTCHGRRGPQPRPRHPARPSARLARAIPGATTHDIDAGHAAAPSRPRCSCPPSSRRRLRSTPDHGTSERSRASAASPRSEDGRACRDHRSVAPARPAARDHDFAPAFFFGWASAS